MDEEATPPWLMGVVFFATYLVVAVLVTGFWKGWTAVPGALATDAFTGAVVAVVFALAVRWFQGNARGDA